MGRWRPRTLLCRGLSEPRDPPGRPSYCCWTYGIQASPRVPTWLEARVGSLGGSSMGSACPRQKTVPDPVHARADGTRPSVGGEVTVSVCACPQHPFQICLLHFCKKSPNSVRPGQATGHRSFGWRSSPEELARGPSVCHFIQAASLEPPHSPHLERTGPQTPRPRLSLSVSARRGCPRLSLGSTHLSLGSPRRLEQPVGQTFPEPPLNANSFSSSSESHRHGQPW